ncbi:hypothetical protein [Streptomyces sp. NPDC012616]|uniref:hypothetical protein n=1 Tax=Streptomyces sp. NPDC012616 TaxID=3364840 RepID=UPI0036EF9ED8
MSVTSELSEPNSPLCRFMRRELPATARITASLRSRMPLRAPTVAPQSTQRPAYRSLGRAIDRRLRVAFGSPIDSALQEGVLYAGLDVAKISTRSAGQAVHSAGQALLSELKGQPAAQGATMLRPGSEEERLNRLCFAASHFEEVLRGGLKPGNPLLALEPGAVLDDLLSQVPAYVPGDIARQVELAQTDHALGWVTRLPLDKRICAPMFSGSADVEGADADFIADGRLIDCKATVRPERFGERRDVHQLAAYLLLDYEDTYVLHQVGFYLARQGQLLTWTTEEFLSLLGARRSLPALRTALRQALTDPTTPEPEPDSPDQHGTQEGLFDEDNEA